MAGSFAPRIAIALGLALGATGCGDDDPPPAQPVAPRPTAAASPGATAGKQGNKLPEKLHVEDRVICPVPDKPSDPQNGKCDPKAPSCGEHLYCLSLAQGTYCEPCPERDGIRHVFKDRDFVVEQNRDPFQSFLLQPFIRDPGVVQLEPTRRCVREDQMVATGSSYTELKLVGIVAQGTQRKVLMVNGREGWIIKRGDCVGKEKAVVKDIGTGYITFVVDADTAVANQRAPEEHSVQLNPKQLSFNEPTELPTPAPRTSISPVVPPPPVLPGRSPTGAAPTAPAPAPAGSVPAGSPPAGAAPAGVAPPGTGPAAAPAPARGASIAPPVEIQPTAPQKR